MKNRCVDDVSGKPKYLTKTNSFQKAQDLSNMEPVNQRLIHYDMEQRSKMSHLSVPQTFGERRMSMSRATIVRTAVVSEGRIDALFGCNSTHTVLGKGSYGSVTRVQDAETGREMALKTVHKPSIDNVTRLQREILIMKRLDHPSIVRLHNVYEDATNLFLVLELCEGGELFDRIVASTKFEEKAAAPIMHQILSALAYSHSNNIMHRDIKPENVLYCHDKGHTEGDAGPIKLIDWGFSAKFGNGQKFSSVVGTPFYVAPEVLASYYDYRCDMWSAGVLLYVLLSGAPPFYGEDNKAILRSIRRGKYDMEKKRWHNVSPEAKDLVRHLLVSNPDHRISAMEVMKHSWMRKYAPSKFMITKELGTVIVDKFRYFHGMSPIQRIGFTCMATLLNHNEIGSARDIFNAFDTDNDGVLTVSDVLKMVQSTRAFCDDKLHDYLETLDTDGNGTIDYTEFVAAVMNHSEMATDERRVLASFRALVPDSNSDVLTVDDLANVVNQTMRRHSNHLPMSTPREEAKRIIDESLYSESGTLSYSNFLMELRKPHQNYPQHRSRLYSEHAVGITRRKRSAQLFSACKTTDSVAM